MDIKYSLCPKLVVRVARLPFKSSFTRADLLEVLHNDVFAEALYIAAPGLYQTYLKWKQGRLDAAQEEKLYATLTKYYVRMMSRSTPFGLFAGCTRIEMVSSPDNSELVVEHPIHRRTRFDMGFFKYLSDYISSLPYINSRLRYHANSSIYFLGDEVRFLESTYAEGKKIYHLASVQQSEYLLKLIAQSRHAVSTIDALINCISDDESPEEDFRTFVWTLIDMQILVNELAPAITGKDPLSDLIAVLNRIANEQAGSADHARITDLIQWLVALYKHIEALDLSDFSIQNYENIVSLFNERVNYDPEKNSVNFQVDYSLNCSGTISTAYEKPLLDALNMSSLLAVAQENYLLKDFKRKFAERYGESEIPLLVALDVENGIGYSQAANSLVSPLVDDLSLNHAVQADQVIAWDGIRMFLFRKWKAAFEGHHAEIEIKDEELSAIGYTQAKNKLPASFSIVFRIVKEQIIIENIGGSSATTLISRFAGLDPGIHALADEIVKQEQLHHPQVEFCEIIHLPQDRIGNILMHPPFLKYEIPYLSQSSVGNKNTLLLSDMYLYIENDRLILRHKDLEKEIIPRLSNAHNFSGNSLPLYHFLADLQTQDLQANVAFSWDNLIPDLGYYPRVVYKNVVIYPQSWKLSHEQYADLNQIEDDHLVEQLRCFAERLNLPEQFLLKDGDNELFVDIRNVLTLKAFISAIKNRDKIILREFIFDEMTSLVKNREGEGYYNQFIASVINMGKDPIYPLSVFDQPALQVQSDFSLGSEWLYYKLYCGENTADLLLIDVIMPLVEELMAADLIDEWFFIRYKDPNNHLRIRFHLKNTDFISSVLLSVNRCVQPFLLSGQVWDIQTATYKRELKRYGYHLIKWSEEIFHQDTIHVLKILDLIKQGEDDTLELNDTLKLMVCVKGVDDMMNGFTLSIDEKVCIARKMRNSFFNEFQGEKKLKKELDQKYRAFRPVLHDFINDEAGAYQPYHLILLDRFNAQKGIFHTLSIQLTIPERDAILLSHIHMFINRLFNSNQRKLELLVYEILLKHLISISKRHTP